MWSPCNLYWKVTAIFIALVLCLVVFTGCVFKSRIEIEKVDSSEAAASVASGQEEQQ